MLHVSLSVLLRCFSAIILHSAQYDALFGCLHKHGNKPTAIHKTAIYKDLGTLGMKYGYEEQGRPEEEGNVLRW